MLLISMATLVFSACKCALNWAEKEYGDGKESGCIIKEMYKNTKTVNYSMGMFRFGVE